MQGESQRTVLVLGASGFIGCAVAQYLRKQSYQVFAPTSSECDLLAADSLAAYIAPLPQDLHVVFCAAITRQREDTPEAMMKNLRMAASFNIAIQSHPIATLVYLSSVDVYGIPSEFPIEEQTPIAPAYYYGTSKACSEYMLKPAGEGRCCNTILRLPGIYGLGDSGKSTIGAFCRRIACGDQIRLWGGGSALRDYVAVHDLCRLVYRLLRTPYDGVLNVATGTSISIRQIVEFAADALGVAARIECVPQGGEPQYDMVFRVDRLRSTAPELDFTSIALGVRDYAVRQLWRTAPLLVHA